MMKMGIRKLGDAVSTATTATYESMDRASSRGRSMSSSELLRRRHSPHQRITDREEDHEEDSGSGDDSGDGSDSEGDDGKGNEGDQSTTEDEDDNEEQTVTEERTITQEHTATINHTQTVTASPVAGDIKNKHFSGVQTPPDPASFSGWSHHTGKRSSSTGIISTPDPPRENTPESTSVSSQEHTTASPMADDGKRSMSSLGFISLEDPSDEVAPESASDASNDDSSATTMSRPYKILNLQTSGTEIVTATLSKTTTFTQTQGQPNSLGEGAATTGSHGTANLAAQAQLSSTAPAGSSGNTDSLHYPDPSSTVEPADLGSDEVTDSSGIVSSTPGPILPEDSTFSSSTLPVTTSTNPETELIPSTTSISLVYPTPSDGQDLSGGATTGIDSTIKHGGASPEHGDDSIGHTNRPPSPTTTPTIVGGITTPGNFSTRSELPITSPTSSTHPADSVIASEGKEDTSSDDVLKKGAIIGAIAGLVVFGVLLFFLWRKRKHNKKRHSNSSTSHLLTSTSKSAGKLPDKDPYPFDDNDDRGSIGGESIGRTSQWTFEGVATAIRNSMRQSVGGGLGITGPGPVSPVSPSGDAASLGGLSSVSRGSSFSYASDDYSCRGSAASNASDIYQATALAYPTPGRVTPVMPAYPATAKIVNLSPKPQKPEMVMVRNNRNSSTAELLGLSRNPSKSTTGKSGKGMGQWDKEACGCDGSRKGVGQWDKEACGCDSSRASTSSSVVSPPPMAARSLYEALGGSGPGPVSPPSSSRPVTWMRPVQPSPLSTARNSASSAFVPSPIVGTSMPGSNRRSYMS